MEQIAVVSRRLERSGAFLFSRSQHAFANCDCVQFINNRCQQFKLLHLSLVTVSLRKFQCFLARQFWIDPGVD